MDEPKKKFGGRPKGAKNKHTKEMREIVRQAFDQAGGVQYLTEVAKSDPRSFLTLVGKLIPLEVTGADGGPVQTAISVSFAHPPR